MSSTGTTSIHGGPLPGEEIQGELGTVDYILRSSVKLETNAKGLVQTKITVYAGESADEMQRLADLAIRTYEVVTNQLGARTQIN